MSVIAVHLGTIKQNAAAGIHLKSQVDESVPQEDTVTQSQKPHITVSRLAPVMLKIRARQHYTASTQHNVLTHVILKGHIHS